MRTWILSVITVIIGAVVVTASFSGCGQQNTASNANSVFPGSCNGTGCNSTSTFVGGDTETLNIASVYALSQYAGMQISNPTNVQVNINLTPVGTSPQVFLGQMVIQYNDGNGGVHVGTFVNGTSTAGWRGYPNNVSLLVGSTYRIFFEDSVGALVLTITNPAGADTALTSTGQIWFYNFNSNAPNPLFTGATDSGGTYYPPGYVFCWMIDLGPYDCRNMTVPPVNQDTTNGVVAFSLLGSIPTINLDAALGL
jgi:hypothetical protein